MLHLILLALRVRVGRSQHLVNLSAKISWSVFVVFVYNLYTCSLSFCSILFQWLSNAICFEFQVVEFGLMQMPKQKPQIHKWTVRSTNQSNPQMCFPPDSTIKNNWSLWERCARGKDYSLCVSLTKVITSKVLSLCKWLFTTVVERCALTWPCRWLI